MPLRSNDKDLSLKRSLVVALISALTIGACGWIGYGNPFREIPDSGPGNEFDLRRAFFAGSCDAKGLCKYNPKYKRVMHFSFGDGVMGPPGDIQGKGRNPVAMARKLGLRFLPAADYQSAAVKWCTSGEIFRLQGYHGWALAVPIPDDPVKTARCVQDQLPRPFSVSIGDPQGFKRERKAFAPLYPSWKRSALVDD